MDLTHWSDAELDRTRLKRLGVGYLLGAALIAITVTAFALSASGKVQQEDEGLEVAFVSEVAEEEEAEPEPEPEPEPPPAAPMPQQPQMPQAPPARALAELKAPESIPDGPVEEKDANVNSGGASLDPYGDTSVPRSGNGSSGRVRSAPPPSPPPPPPPKPKPRRKKPRRLTEDMTPPRALSTPQPGYPAALRKQGIEGTVIVRFIVTASGRTRSVRAVRGPSALRASCVAAVKRWRFKPALDAQGNPVAVPKTMRFPFRIKARR